MVPGPMHAGGVTEISRESSESASDHPRNPAPKNPCTPEAVPEVSLFQEVGEVFGCVAW